jgi:signal transduction histidine kinase/ActR/RegA family two-component response regulator
VSGESSDTSPRVAELERQLADREREIARLDKIRRALIDRAVRSTEADTGGAFGLLESQVVLSQQVRRRTRELEELNAKLIAAKEEAEAAARARTTFLSTMSHEIRTPLNGILGMTTLLIGTELSAEQEEYAETIRTCGSSLLELINDILDFSKLDSRGVVPESLIFDPRDLINDVSLMLSERVHAKGLAFLQQVEPAVPRLVVGDPGRLRQVLLNLAGNAVKFTEAGTVSVRLGMDGGTPLRLRFRITDTGVGIPDEAIPKLFRPFVQADASTTRKFGGTGLGLAICRQIVELLGGEIGVESRVETGSTFWFTVGVELPAEEALARRKDLATKAKGQIPVDQVAAGRRVLVVEDNAVNQKVAAALLHRMGARVDVAANGREAVEACEKVGYDLVFMDCQMPVMDGYQATAAIRDQEASRGGPARLPIIALTAHAMPGDSQRCLGAGMDDYITKPVSPGEMVAMLQKWLGSPPGR